jgi:DHA3 family tetracycline resistance protein-like MFS transporter
VFLGQASLSLPIVVGGALSILLAGFLLAFMPEEEFRPAPVQERRSWTAMADTVGQSVELVRRRPPLLTYFAIVAFIGLSSEGYDRLWTLHLLDNFTFPSVGALGSEAWFGIMRAGAMLLTLGGTELVRRRTASAAPEDITRTLQVVYAVMVGAVILLALTGNVLLAILAYWVIEMARRTAEPLETAWVNRQIESRVRATVLSATSQINAIGQIVGGPAVGAIGRVVSLRAALSTTAVILAPVVVLYGRANRQMGRPPADDGLRPPEGWDHGRKGDS